MEISKIFELSRIEEIKILHNVRLVHRNDLNSIFSKDNLRVQFNITGELLGTISCYLCLDDKDLGPTDKNYLFPLFVESMNILVGKQISLDDELGKFKLHMSAPKLNMNSTELNTELKRSMMQKYHLEMKGSVYNVLIEYTLTALN